VRPIAVRIAASIVIVFALLLGSVAVFSGNATPVIAGTQYSSLVKTFIDGEGREIAAITVNGKPPETTSEVVNAPEPDVQMGINVLSDVPAFDWSYGCSATSAAMLFGYYDRTGYSNIYVGSTNGGVCPLDNSIWGDTSYPHVTCHECPLSATHQGTDNLTSKGHVDDYWVDYGSSGSDPYITGDWTEHTQGDCTGDFMGTNQSNFGNTDGATTFYFYTSGSPLYDYTGDEPGSRDGCHGVRLFAESRGYTVTANFNQLIAGYKGTSPGKGFTFADYVSEIDAGRPVLIQVKGHTMLGYGYDTTGEKIYVRDTWDHSSHQMTWGGSYSGMEHYGVTVLRLGSGSTPPSVTTNDASNVTASYARLNGNLSSLGAAPSVMVSFQWGTSSASYSNETTPQTKTATGVFSSDLGSLSPATTYYFRAKAVGNGTTYSAEKSFTTSTVSPSVTTNSATNISTSSASLNGNLSSLGSASNDEVSFQWGASPGIYPNETTPQTMTAVGLFSFDLTDLDPGTTCYFRAKAVGHGTSYGDGSSFATLTTPPSVATSDATNVAITSATLNGSLDSLGTASGINLSFQWGTSSGSYSNETTLQVRTTTGAFGFDLAGLSPGTTYYYRAGAVGHGTSYGAERSFRTLTTPPLVVTNDASNVTTDSAELNGSLTSVGTASSIEVSFQWSTSPESYSNETAAQVKTTTGEFSFDLSSLTPGTTYYFRAKAVGDGTSYGMEQSFAASTTPPSVATSEPANMTTNSARLSGNLTSLGTASNVDVSFQWGTSPGYYQNETTPQVMTTTGEFIFDLSSLTPGTTYYFRAKAIGDGTSYGIERSLTTWTTPPTVNTSNATNVAATSATLNGNLVSPGTASMVTVSFQWGTSPGAYTDESTSQTMNAAGAFSIQLSDLQPETTYYFRAKAVGHGASYGTEGSFTTATIPPSVTATDATGITTSKATLNASLVSLGTAEMVNVSFRWGTTTGGPYPNQATSQSMTAAGTIGLEVDGLTPGTTYYYVVEATGNGTASAAEKSFATLSPPLPVGTGSMTDAPNVDGTASAVPAEPFHWPVLWTVAGAVVVLGSLAFLFMRGLAR